MTMLAVEIAAPGGPEVLRLVPRPRPLAQAGEALIRVGASGVNRPDVLQRKGLYPPPPGASDIPGLEVAGVIESGDAAALSQAGLAVGQRVCALVSGGGYAQWCAVPVAQCLPVPEGFSYVQAASLPETVFTVWSNVFQRGMLQPGETLLVQGGASGIGVMAIQIAKALGARVAATAGAPEKCVACLQLGADMAIDYRQQDFAAVVMDWTGAQGVDVILDMVAGDYLAREIPCLRPDGRLVIISVQGGTRCTLDAGLVLRKRLTITGSALRARDAAFKAALTQAVRQHVWPLLEQGRVKPVVDSVLPPAHAAQGHARMEAGQHIGKIILDWSAA